MWHFVGAQSLGLSASVVESLGSGTGAFARTLSSLVDE